MYSYDTDNPTFKTIVARGLKPNHALLLCASLMMALGFNQNGLNLDSATYAVIARNMAELARWFNPTYTEFVHPQFAEHPPLVMWAQGIIFLLTGASDSTARLFGAFCTIGSVLTVFYIGKQLKNEAYGFCSGLTLLLTYNFMQIGNSTLLDTPMTFFSLLALLWFLKASVQVDSKRFPFLTGLALGAAFLSKGVVSAPIWIAIFLAPAVMESHLYRRVRFWNTFIFAFLLIGLYLVLDWVYADSRFLKHYFLTQVWSRFLGGGPEIHTDWYEYSYRFVKLYLPYSVGLPIGVYIAVRQKVLGLIPLAVALAFYFLFYSSAAKLYYHYFVPAYALASLFVGLVIYQLLSEHILNRIRQFLIPVWLVAAALVLAFNLPIHHIRVPEVYDKTGQIKDYFDGESHLQGLLIHSGEPNWDYIAKAAWYWRSDLKPVQGFTEAAKRISDSSFLLIVVPLTIRDTSYDLSLLPEHLHDSLAKFEGLDPLVQSNTLLVFARKKGGE